MATMNISLSDSLVEHVKKSVESEGYSTVSEYFRHLVRKDQETTAKNYINSLISEALNSPTTPLTEDDWLNLRLKLEQHRAKK